MHQFAAAVMGKKKGGGPKGTEFWDGLTGWKTVDVKGDDLLLGADEYGFCGLEELDASQLGEPPPLPPLPAAAAAACCCDCCPRGPHSMLLFAASLTAAPLLMACPCR